MIEVIDTLEKLDAIKDAWRKLELNPNLRVQQTFIWNRTGWVHYNSKEPKARLRVLKWYQDGKDNVVIFPFYIDGKGTLRFLMDAHSDILDAVYEAGVNLYHPFKEAADWIIASKEVRRVHFRQMYGVGEAFNYFGVLLPTPIIYRDHAFSWLESIATDNFIAEQKQLRQKERSRLKALLRKSDGYTFKILSKSAGDEYPESAILKLRAYLVANTRRTLAFFPDNLIKFSNVLFDNGVCEIPIFEDENGVHALAFRLLKGMRINFWIFMYDDNRLPTELYVKYMMERAKGEARIFDFGAGAYKYKLQTFCPKLGVTFSLRMAKSPWGQLMAVKDLIVRYAKDYLKPIVRKEH